MASNTIELLLQPSAKQISKLPVQPGGELSSNRDNAFPEQYKKASKVGHAGDESAVKDKEHGENAPQSKQAKNEIDDTSSQRETASKAEVSDVNEEGVNLSHSFETELTAEDGKLLPLGGYILPGEAELQAENSAINAELRPSTVPVIPVTTAPSNGLAASSAQEDASLANRALNLSTSLTDPTSAAQNRNFNVQELTQSATARSTELTTGLVAAPVAGFATGQPPTFDLKGLPVRLAKTAEAVSLNNKSITSSSLQALVEAPAVAVPQPNSADFNRVFAAADPSSVKLAIPGQVGANGWDGAVTQRILFLSSQNIRAADIALDPPELGPLQIRITSQADQATNITFTSHSAVVRETLEQALPRLREVLEGQGIDLGDVDVSNSNSDKSHANQQQQDSAAESSQAENTETDADLQSTAVTAKISSSLIDYFA